MATKKGARKTRKTTSNKRATSRRDTAPKRLDTAKIVLAYKRLGSYKKVADMFDCSTTAVSYHVRKDRGLI